VGKDLIYQETELAARLLVENMDVDVDKVMVTFNSLCDNAFPDGTASVTVVSIGDGSESEEGKDGLSGVAKSVSEGEMYFHLGKWWTVVEEDINSALM